MTCGADSAPGRVRLSLPSCNGGCCPEGYRETTYPVSDIALYLCPPIFHLRGELRGWAKMNIPSTIKTKLWSANRKNRIPYDHNNGYISDIIFTKKEQNKQRNLEKNPDCPGLYRKAVALKIRLDYDSLASHLRTLNLYVDSIIESCKVITFFKVMFGKNWWQNPRRLIYYSSLVSYLLIKIH